MIDLLLDLLIILIIVGVAYWAAGLLGAPHPIPTLILVIGVVIAVIVLISGLGSVGEGDVAQRIR